MHEKMLKTEILSIQRAMKCWENLVRRDGGGGDSQDVGEPQKKKEVSEH